MFREDYGLLQPVGILQRHQQEFISGRQRPVHRLHAGEILNALIDHQGKSNTEIADEKGLNYQQVRVLGYLRADRHITAAKIAKDLDMSARQIERMLADLITTISGISLLVSGLHDSHKQTVIVAGFILLLDLIMIVAFLVDYLRKS